MTEILEPPTEVIYESDIDFVAEADAEERRFEQWREISECCGGRSRDCGYHYGQYPVGPEPDTSDDDHDRYIDNLY